MTNGPFEFLERCKNVAVAVRKMLMTSLLDLMEAAE